MAPYAYAQRLAQLATLLFAVFSRVVTSSSDQDEDGLEQQCIGVGIDLGTTQSAVALCTSSGCEVIRNPFGNSITPSVVYYSPDGAEVKVGEPAQHQRDGPHGDSNTIYIAKNFIGRQYEEVKELAQKMPYKVTKNKNGQAVAIINGKEKLFSEVSGEILKYLSQYAKTYIKTLKLGDFPLEFIVTVPAYFNNNMRKGTKDSGSFAGISVANLISEPVAASFYGLDESISLACVIDIGGGTVDNTVLTIEDGVYRTISTTGHLNLGGNNFDTLIVNWMKKQAKAKGIEIEDTENELRAKAEGFKIDLSKSVVAETPYGPLTIAAFNEMMQESEEIVYNLVKEAIQKANKTVDEIDTFYLTGGSSSMPIWSKMIRKRFRKEPLLSKDPDHSVALGAAILASQKCNHGKTDKVIINNLAFGYGVKSRSGNLDVTTFIVDPNVPVPTTQTKTFSTAVDYQTGVSVEIYQGFDQNTSNNVLVGKIQYDGLPSRRAGQVEVDIKFHINEEQIMTATVTGKYPNAPTKELVLSLEDNIDPEEIESRKAQAKVDSERFTFILEVETALAEPKYALESSIVRDHLEEPHKKFVEELIAEWEAIKANQGLTPQEMKDQFEPKMKEAEPIFKKMIEAKQKVISEYDSKHSESTAGASQAETADSSSAPEDL